eukprot:scaffold99827_cov59-Phaeocystis_antarctica.AAC.2
MMCYPCTPDRRCPPRGRAWCRGLRVAERDLGPKPLLAKLRAQLPGLGAGTREVREALMALKAESERPWLSPPPCHPLPNAAVSLACFGCARLPSDMDDDREPLFRTVALCSAYFPPR